LLLSRYYYGDRIKEIEWIEHVECMGKIYAGFFQKHEGKRQFVRPRFRQEDNIKTILKELDWNV
jgi:hypothetical protein